MSMRPYGLLAGAVVLSALSLSQPASALTMRECSVKYAAAKSAGTLTAKTGNDFRKDECGTVAALAPKPAVPEPKPTVPAATGLTMQECSAMYQAAKAGGTLGGATWNDFRKSQCSAEQAAAPTPIKVKATTAATTPSAGNAVFPNAIAKKYATQRAGQARMHTCLDQYRANKATNGNGSLKWTEKGGGYYSECNKRLSQK